MQQGPIKYGRIWRNLPLRVKALACLLAPVPALALIIILLALFGARQFRVVLIPAVTLEVLAAAWLVETLLQSIYDLRQATERLRRGDPIPEIRRHSWELNGMAASVEALAAVIQEQQAAVGAAELEAARLFEEAPLAYLETDDRGTVRRSNPAAAELLGRSPEELAGRAMWEILGATAMEREREYVRPDGRRVMLSISESPRHDATGASGFLYSLTDTTERRAASAKVAEAQAELRRKDEEVAKAMARAEEAGEGRTRFLSNMSEDLRAPINGMVGFAELLFDGKVGAVSQEQRECLGDILASGRHMLQLVDGLLDSARQPTGRAPAVKRESVDVAAAIQEVRYVIEVLAAQRRRVLVTAEVDRAVRQVAVDAVCVKQVIQSYLSQAVKLSPKGGQITVRAEAEGTMALRLEVEYSRAAVHDRQGEESQVRSSIDTVPKLVKESVEVQGGRTGTRPGHARNTVLFAVLPISPGSDAAAKAPVVRLVQKSLDDRRVCVIVSSGQENGIRTFLERPEDPEHLRRSLEHAGVPADARRAILVVGHNLDTLGATLNTLSGFGYRPVCLRSVRNVLECAAQEDPAAVVLDLESAGLEDFEFVETAVRSVGLALPVIALLDRELTATDSAQLQRRALGLAAPKVRRMPA